MRRWQAAAFVGLFLVQVAPSVTLAWQQTHRLARGRPILLTVTTRDPRDLFRGEYSTLAYEIGRLRGLPVPPDALGVECDLARRETCRVGSRTLYVRLAPDAEGVHRAVGATFARPAEGELYLAGTLRGGTLLRSGASDPALGSAAVPCAEPACLSGQVSYGIETWYGPQGVPARLDAAARRDVRVEARVDAQGVAALDGVLVGGERFARTVRFWR